MDGTKTWWYGGGGVKNSEKMPTLFMNVPKFDFRKAFYLNTFGRPRTWLKFCEILITCDQFPYLSSWKHHNPNGTLNNYIFNNRQNHSSLVYYSTLMWRWSLFLLGRMQKFLTRWHLQRCRQTFMWWAVGPLRDHPYITSVYFCTFSDPPLCQHEYSTECRPKWSFYKTNLPSPFADVI